MPYILEDLVIDRVDLVDEGANSAAFIEVFKRKEQNMDFSEILSKMKPEHASVIQQELEAVKEDLAKSRNENETLTAELTKAREDNAGLTTQLEEALAKAAPAMCECDGEADEHGVCKACGKPKKGVGFDEAEVLKAMPEAARAAFLKMREQKEAAEEQVRKAAEEKLEAEAVAKAATMKSLPVEQSELVEILKNCDPKIAEVLSAASAAIDNVVLEEVGKGKPAQVDSDAWSKIETKATEIVTRDNVTKQKAIAIAIKENPELYREYLNGGAM